MKWLPSNKIMVGKYRSVHDKNGYDNSAMRPETGKKKERSELTKGLGIRGVEATISTIII
jgi:hypothetical protein